MRFGAKYLGTAATVIWIGLTWDMVSSPLSWPFIAAVCYLGGTMWGLVMWWLVMRKSELSSRHDG